MAHAIQIDTLAFAKKLRAAGADEKLADAIVEGLTAVDTSELVTKNDLRSELKNLELRMTIRLGSIMTVGVGVIATLVAFF